MTRLFMIKSQPRSNLSLHFSLHVSEMLILRISKSGDELFSTQIFPTGNKWLRKSDKRNFKLQPNEYNQKHSYFFPTNIEF